MHALAPVRGLTISVLYRTWLFNNKHAYAGFQAQTAECLVVGEIAARSMVVALNKTDLLPEALRPKAVKKATKLIRETLAATKFAGAAVIPVAAKPSERQEVAGAGLRSHSTYAACWQILRAGSCRTETVLCTCVRQLDLPARAASLLHFTGALLHHACTASAMLCDH